MQLGHVGVVGVQLHSLLSLALGIISFIIYPAYLSFNVPILTYCVIDQR